MDNANEKMKLFEAATIETDAALVESIKSAKENGSSMNKEEFAAWIDSL